MKTETEGLSRPNDTFSKLCNLAEAFIMEKYPNVVHLKWYLLKPILADFAQSPEVRELLSRQEVTHD